MSAGADGAPPPPSLGLAALRLAPLRSAAPPGGQAQRNPCPRSRINLQQQPTQWGPLRANKKTAPAGSAFRATSVGLPRGSLLFSFGRLYRLLFACSPTSTNPILFFMATKKGISHFYTFWKAGIREPDPHELAPSLPA